MLNKQRQSLVDVFNESQHITNNALEKLKDLYQATPFDDFESTFKDCIRKLLQSKHSIYFKGSCDVICKFLQHVSQLSDEAKRSQRESNAGENIAPTRRGTKRGARGGPSSEAPVNTRNTRGAAKRRRRANADDVQDEILIEYYQERSRIAADENSDSDEDPLISQSMMSKRRKTTVNSASSSLITDHDRLLSSCIDIVDLYMEVTDEGCRLNAVYFVSKFLNLVRSLDEEICKALKSTLPKRIRDKKPMIRAQAVIASRIFQHEKMTKEAFLHHFSRDPELVVRKALLQVMDTNIFGYDFLIDSTQDSHELMRKAAYQRLGKLNPSELNSKQLHRVLNNGMNERGRNVSQCFKTSTLKIWLSQLYDGNDLCKLVESFDVINYRDDVCRLLDQVYENFLDDIQNNGTTTKLHLIVESFRAQWLSGNNMCLPNIESLNERIMIVWLSLLNYCKKEQDRVKCIKIRTVQQSGDTDESIEKMIDSQEMADERSHMFERLTPDLVNLVDFLKRFVINADTILKENSEKTQALEFIYHRIMDMIADYDVGDELERKTVQDVFGNILKENLLTGRFNSFIPPLVKCLFRLIYSSSSDLMINYIAELIVNVRSHLEDLISTTQLPPPATTTVGRPSIITGHSRVPRSAKKVRIEAQERANRVLSEQAQQNLEYKMATLRVDYQELTDKLEACIKDKDFDQAKVINEKMSDVKAEMNMLHSRRCSIASDVSHMSIFETEPLGNEKLHSTMIGDVTSQMNESQMSIQQNRDENRLLFKHHTNDLLKCLQMYFGCLQNVKVVTIPQIMINHLNLMTYEGLDPWYKNDVRVRSLIIACHGLTALVDKQHAKVPQNLALLSDAMDPTQPLEVRTCGFKSLVDIICEHNTEGDENADDSIDMPINKVESFLKMNLRDYGKYDPNAMTSSENDYITAIVEGTAKLFYHQRLSSSEILSHLIIWWYHPRTPSRLKQFIGIFLPTFVADMMKKLSIQESDWLQTLLEDTFVMSLERLHKYILGEGRDIMAAGDMQSLTAFLCTLIPVSFHARLADKVDDRLDTPNINPDLGKYLKQSKNNLSIREPTDQQEAPLAEPISTTKISD